MSKKILLFLFLALFSISTFAQNSDYGRVTEVLDGRTVVISNADKKTTFMLQYIEVPEPEQQFSSVAKEHLEKLVLGKDVKFVSRSSYSRGLVGSLFLGDIEINKQMLRDGAAWYNLPEYGKRNSEYENMETLAKNEKRGVWSIEGLKPAWEFREEQFAKNIEVKKATQKPARETQMWANTGSTSGVNGFNTSYDKFKNLTEIKTSEMHLDVKPYRRETEFSFQISHFFKGEKLENISDGYYTITIRSKGTMAIIGINPELRLLIGNERILLTSPELSFGNYPYPSPMFYEDKSNTYKFNNEQFSIITTGVDVEFRYGSYECVISAGQVAVLKNMP